MIGANFGSLTGVGKDALRLSPLFLIALTTLNLQCAKYHESGAAQGGEDSGGGFVKSSTPESVDSTLNLAIQLATEADSQNNIFVQFWKSEASKLTAVSSSRIFPNFQSGDPKIKFESPALQALRQNKVTRLQKGDCPQSIAGKHADASVSSLSLNATVCFSIGNLTRLTPDVLLKKILALELHEAAHMGGAEEDEAIALQDAFDSYFGKRFGEIPSPALVGEVFKRLSVIRIHLTRAQKLAAENPANNRILGILGNVAEELESLPYFNDSLAIRLKINPPNPELIDAYSKSVLALAQMLQAKVEQHKSGYAIEAIDPATDDPVEKEAIGPLLDEVARDLDGITEKFLAVVGTSAAEFRLDGSEDDRT